MSLLRRDRRALKQMRFYDRQIKLAGVADHKIPPSVLDGYCWFMKRRSDRFRPADYPWSKDARHTERARAAMLFYWCKGIATGRTR